MKYKDTGGFDYSHLHHGGRAVVVEGDLHVEVFAFTGKVPDDDVTSNQNIRHEAYQFLCQLSFDRFRTRSSDYFPRSILSVTTVHPAQLQSLFWYRQCFERLVERPLPGLGVVVRLF